MQKRIYGLITVLTFFAISCGVEIPKNVEVELASLNHDLGFNADIQGILSDKCYACHGPDEAARQAELDLSTSSGAYSVIKKGRKENSILFQRLVSNDPELRMPPPESTHLLSAREIALIGTWIDQGSPWEEHWAYLKPVAQKSPKLEEDKWSYNEIDRFVFAKLLSNDLEPNEEASREHLLRRLSIDLRGLPPSIDEIDKFISDDSENSYEKVVDKFLDSDDFGERMAIPWLDLARYADTHGYTVDRYRDHYWYRDWVIKAFNQNLPFDDFVTWQLAGDLLPDPTRDQLIATGFNRNHAQNTEGGIVNEEFLAEYVFDRTETFGTAFLGTTLNCARCHDHKFDPIQQKEYFQIFDFFNNVDESGQIAYDQHSIPAPTLLLTSEEDDEELSRLDSLIERKEIELESIDKSFASDFDSNKYLNESWTVRNEAVGISDLEEISIENIPNLADRKTDGNVFDPIDGVLSKSPLVLVDGISGQAVKLSGDEALYFPELGKINEYDPITVGLWVSIPDSLEEGVIFHNNKGSIFYNYRGFHLYLKNNKLEIVFAQAFPGNAIHLESEAPVERGQWQHVAMTYDGSSKARGVRLYINGKQAILKVVRDNLYKDIVQSPGNEPGLKFGARFRGKGLAGASIDEIAIFDYQLQDLEISWLASENSLSATFSTNQLDPINKSDLAQFVLRRKNSTYKNEAKQLRELRKKRSQLANSIEQAMIVREAKDKPSHILIRGQYDSPGESVRSGTPSSILTFAEDLPSNRLGLSRWLLDEDNPLFSRVSVNRFWQQIFGQGIVKTSEDFGIQGARPSHPELLDWLAIEFRESGWDVKNLMKTMVMSATYRQSSFGDFPKDPDNVLLSRGPSSRLTAEQLRDQVLAASDLLNPQIGGPSVRPYQPEGLWRVNSGSYEQSKGPDLYRKSIYSLWKRSVPPPSMNIFDAPSRSYCLTRRQETATPLQALTLLNDPQFLEASRVLAYRLVDGPSSAEANIVEAYRLLTGIYPDEATLAELITLYNERFSSLSNEEARKLIAIGEFKQGSSSNPIEQAALMLTASTIINLDASMTKR